MKRPIGFIDSGVGGLTVLKEALKQLPNESMIFLGDSARCPYGTRPTEEIRHVGNGAIFTAKEYKNAGYCL